MAKPPVRRVPADDCLVTIGGVKYAVHEGEWVEVIGSASVRENQSFWNMAELVVRPESVEDMPSDEGEAARNRVMRLSRHFDSLCASMARRVVGWNLTDDQGRPLPKPDGTPEPLKDLRDEELYWLRGVLSRDETPSERKNGSSGSDTRSTSTARNRSKRS